MPVSNDPSGRAEAYMRKFASKDPISRAGHATFKGVDQGLLDNGFRGEEIWEAKANCVREGWLRQDDRGVYLLTQKGYDRFWLHIR